jgi:hypothetical protein
MLSHVRERELWMVERVVDGGGVVGGGTWHGRKKGRHEGYAKFPLDSPEQ